MGSCACGIVSNPGYVVYQYLWFATLHVLRTYDLKDVPFSRLEERLPKTQPRHLLLEVRDEVVVDDTHDTRQSVYHIGWNLHGMDCRPINHQGHMSAHNFRVRAIREDFIRGEHRRTYGKREGALVVQN